jgi:hypothetical protein
MAPAVQTLIFGLRLCLPAAPVLPGDNEKFGTILVLWAALGQAERLACAAKVQRSRTTRQPRDLLRLLTAAIGPKRRKTTSARMSAIGGTSGLLVLRMSFVARDPEQPFTQSSICVTPNWDTSVPGPLYRCCGIVLPSQKPIIDAALPGSTGIFSNQTPVLPADLPHALMRPRYRPGGRT